MTPRERVNAAIQGEKVDRPPFAFWRHFPKDDLDPTALAEQHVQFQARVQNDILKHTPAAGYMPEMWGMKLEYKNDEEGARKYIGRVVNSPDEWLTLKRIDMKDPVPSRELKAARLTRLGIPREVPVIQTVFSPVSIAARLRGPEWLKDMKDNSKAFLAGLQTITEMVTIFSLECLREGVDGIFFSTQSTGTDVLTAEEFDEVAGQYDKEILLAIRDKAEILMVHAHGKKPHFDKLVDYPCDILNWHDRETEPSLSEGHQRFKGAVCAGIERTLFLKDDEGPIRERVKDSLSQTGGKRFILGVGCVLPVIAPESLLEAAKSELGV